MKSYPYDPKSILDEEVEDESDHTDEGENGDACTFPCLRLVQLLLCNIPKPSVIISIPLTSDVCHPQYVVPELPQGAPQLLHVEVDGVVILQSAANVRTVLAEIQRVVQDHFVTATMNILNLNLIQT